MSPGEHFGNRTSEFVIPYDYVFPLLKSAENWREKILPVGEASYLYYSKYEKNASATSDDVLVKDEFGVEKPYKYSQVNAALHGWTIIDPDGVDGYIMVGILTTVNTHYITDCSLIYMPL